MAVQIRVMNLFLKTSHPKFAIDFFKLVIFITVISIAELSIGREKMRSFCNLAELRIEIYFFFFFF